MEFKFLFILFSVLLIFGVGQFQHELSHKVIYQEAGCKNISINFNFPNLTTTANCNLTQEMHTALFLAQANVESNYEFQRFDIYFLILFSLLI